MKFNLLTLLIFTAVLALAMAVYSHFAPPILEIGMGRRTVLSHLKAVDAINLIEQNGKTWYSFDVGIFDIEFENNKLKSIKRWDGSKENAVDQLVLQYKPR
ncbi:hypothetical protein OAG71_03345 [bacterium]|nr:hypothetical protein [bacterium]